MTLYGMAANLPCIFVQRANRMKVARILHRSEIRSGKQIPHAAWPLLDLKNRRKGETGNP